jgi:hypothetical protein
LVTIREEHTDEHNYADPFGNGQQKAADAEATKKMADACLKSLEAQQPNVAFGVPFQCGAGYITHGQNGMMYYPYAGAQPYMMNGMGYNGMMMGPTSSTRSPYGGLMPMSSVMPGQPQIVSLVSSTFTPATFGNRPLDGSAGDTSGGNTSPLIPQLSKEEDQQFKELAMKAALCKNNPKRQSEDKECKDAELQLHVLQKSLVDRERTVRSLYDPKHNPPEAEATRAPKMKKNQKAAVKSDTAGGKRREEAAPDTGDGFAHEAPPGVEAPQ